MSRSGVPLALSAVAVLAAFRCFAPSTPIGSTIHVSRTHRNGGANETPNERWYHLTDRARFRLDPRFTPADNAFAFEDRSGRPGIYLAPDVEPWLNGKGYWRPFVAEFRVDPSVKGDPGVHGRYGGEMFVPATSFGKIALLRVIPLDAYAREVFGTAGWIEREIERSFDTGEPLPTQTYAFRNYRYDGPDVRDMPMAETRRLAADLRRVKFPRARRSAS